MKFLCGLPRGTKPVNHFFHFLNEKRLNGRVHFIISILETDSRIGNLDPLRHDLAQHIVVGKRFQSGGGSGYASLGLENFYGLGIIQHPLDELSRFFLFHFARIVVDRHHQRRTYFLTGRLRTFEFG